MYDRAFFDNPVDRRGTACEKWDAAMARDPRLVNPMWVADMDFRCPNEVVQALMARAAHPVYGYTEQTEQAVSAMLGFMERRHGLRLSRDEQIMLPCVVSGLKAAVLAFTRPGERVIVPPADLHGFYLLHFQRMPPSKFFPVEKRYGKMRTFRQPFVYFGSLFGGTDLFYKAR